MHNKPFKPELTDEQRQTEIEVFNTDQEYDRTELDKFTDNLEWETTDFRGIKMRFLVSKSDELKKE